MVKAVDILAALKRLLHTGKHFPPFLVLIKTRDRRFFRGREIGVQLSRLAPSYSNLSSACACNTRNNYFE